MGTAGPDTDVRRAEFSVLFRREQPIVEWFVRTTFPAADRDEVVAETFLTAWQRFESIPTGRETSWLLTTARNHCRNRARRSRTADRVVQTLAGMAVEGTVDEPLELVLDPVLRRALGLLTDDERELVVLHVVAGVASADLATITGRSVGATRVRLHRATKRLRAVFSQLEAAGGDRSVS